MNTNKIVTISLSVLIVIVFVFLIIKSGFSINVFNAQNATTTTSEASTTSGSNSGTTQNTNSVGTTANTSGLNTIVSSTGTVLTDATLAQILLNVKVQVPQTGVDIALTNGQANFVSGSLKGQLVNGRVLGKIVTDTGYDVFTDMTVVIVGQPNISHYVALFHVNPQLSVTYTSAVLIGDRINVLGVTASPQSSTVQAIEQARSFMKSTVVYELTVNYLDRKGLEPLTTTPTVPKTVTLQVLNHVVTQ